MQPDAGTYRWTAAQHESLSSPERAGAVQSVRRRSQQLTRCLCGLNCMCSCVQPMPACFAEPKQCGCGVAGGARRGLQGCIACWACVAVACMAHDFAGDCAPTGACNARCALRKSCLHCQAGARGCATAPCKQLRSRSAQRDAGACCGLQRCRLPRLQPPIAVQREWVC